METELGCVGGGKGPRGAFVLLLLRRNACQAEQVTNSSSELLTQPWDSPLLRSFPPPPSSPLFFPACPLAAFTCDLSAFVEPQRCEGCWTFSDTADAAKGNWSEQPYTENSLSSQLMSCQIKKHYSLSVALMWCRDTVVTPEQCQDKCHPIKQRNTTLLWPLSNLSLNFDRKIYHRHLL